MMNELIAFFKSANVSQEYLNINITGNRFSSGAYSLSACYITLSKSTSPVHYTVDAPYPTGTNR